jgi:hypothetical protein
MLKTWLFRQHFQTTVTFFLIFSLVVMSPNHFSNPRMDCTFGQNPPDSYQAMVSYCWSNSTFVVSPNEKKPSLHRRAGAKTPEEEEIKYISYYLMAGYVNI